MDRQQTEQINNAANIGLYDLQSLLLQGYYFDGNPKSEAISSSETACTAGVKWLLNANSGAAAHEYIPVDDLGRDIGINIAEGSINSQLDYLGLPGRESITNRDFLSSGNGSSVSNEIFRLINLHGRQYSMQQFDNIACRNPNVSSAAQEYLENCHNNGERNYISNVAGCSLNPQDMLTLSNVYQTSPDFPSSYQRLEEVSFDELRNINDSYSSSEYSSVGMLRCSKYVRAAQQLLEEVCNGAPQYKALYVAGALNLHSKRSSDDPLHDHMKAAPSSTCRKQQSKYMRAGEGLLNLQLRKSLLIGMVEQLDRAYQQYQEQMQLIITSFESATGMYAAAPYTALAKRMISRRFRALRDAIGEQIHDTCSMLGDDISTVPILSKGETPRLRILDQRLRHHRTLQQVTMLPQLWRPQRGLPERSVAVLRAWLFEHFLNPYPKGSEKLMLARLTGLTRGQVANWFINARVRLWKPMVEQMYAEEKKEAESQNQAVAEQKYEQTIITDYGSSCGFKGNDVMAQAIRENPPKRHRYEQLVHEERNSRTSHSFL